MLDTFLEFLRGNRRAAQAIGVFSSTVIVLCAMLAAGWTASLQVTIVVLLPVLIVTQAGLLVLLDSLDSRPPEEGLQRLQTMAEGGRRLAIYDRETGLFAYWYFDLRMQEEIARSERYSEPFALILIEAVQGRAAPEAELHLFNTMREGLRATDLVAHLGSLRFIALLPRSTAEDAELVSARLSSSVGEGQVHIGIATYPNDGTDMATLLGFAESSAQAA